MDGIAIAFCDSSEKNLLRSIERLIRRPISVLKDHPFEGAASQAPRDNVPNFGSGIDRPHRPAPRHGGFRSHSSSSSNNRTAPRTGGVGFTKAGFARSGSRY